MRGAVRLALPLFLLGGLASLLMAAFVSAARHGDPLRAALLGVAWLLVFLAFTGATRQAAQVWRARR